MVFCHPHGFCLIGSHSVSLSLLLFEALLWKWTCPMSHLCQALNPFFTFLLSHALCLTLMQQKLHFSQYFPSDLSSVKSLFVVLSVLSMPFYLFLISTLKKIFFFFFIFCCKNLPFLLTNLSLCPSSHLFNISHRV